MSWRGVLTGRPTGVAARVTDMTAYLLLRVDRTLVCSRNRTRTGLVTQFWQGGGGRLKDVCLTNPRVAGVVDLDALEMAPFSIEPGVAEMWRSSSPA